MAIRVLNATDQTVPVIIPSKDGGEEVRLAARQTVVLALDKATPQIDKLVNKGILKIRK